LAHRTLVGLPVDFIVREAAHAFEDWVRERQMKQHLYVDRYKSFNETLNVEAVKAATWPPVRLQEVTGAQWERHLQQPGAAEMDDRYAGSVKTPITQAESIGRSRTKSSNRIRTFPRWPDFGWLSSVSEQAEQQDLVSLLESRGIGYAVVGGLCPVIGDIQMMTDVMVCVNQTIHEARHVVGRRLLIFGGASNKIVAGQA
jgi:hypothetical protein